MIKKILFLLLIMHLVSGLGFAEPSEISILLEEAKVYQIEDHHEKAIETYQLIRENSQLTEGQKYQIEYEIAYSQMMQGDLTEIESLVNRDQLFIEDRLYRYEEGGFDEEVNISILKTIWTYAIETDKIRNQTYYRLQSDLGYIYKRVVVYDLDKLKDEIPIEKLMDYLIALNKRYPHCSYLVEDTGVLYFDLLKKVHELQGAGLYAEASQILDHMMPVYQIFQDEKYRMEYKWTVEYEKAYNDLKLGNAKTLQDLMQRDEDLLRDARYDGNNFQSRYSSMVKIAFFKPAVEYGLMNGLLEESLYFGYTQSLEAAYFRFTLSDYRMQLEDLTDEEVLELLLHIDSMYPHFEDLKVAIERKYGELGRYREMDTHIKQVYETYGIEFMYYHGSHVDEMNSYYKTWFDETLKGNTLDEAEGIYINFNEWLENYSNYDLEVESVMLYHLAEAYQALGDENKAFEYYQLLMNIIFPDNEAWDDLLYARKFRDVLPMDVMMKGVMDYAVLGNDQMDEETHKKVVKKLNEFYDQESLEVFDEAVELFNDQAYDQAVEAFEEILRIRPYHQESLSYLTQRYTLQGEANEAIDYLNGLDELSDQRTENLLMFLYEMNGEYKKSQTLQNESMVGFFNQFGFSLPIGLTSVLVTITTTFTIIIAAGLFIKRLIQKPIMYSQVVKNIYLEKKILESVLHDVHIASDIHTEIEVD